MGAAEGCRPQVRELGLRGAGNQVFRRLLTQTHVYRVGDVIQPSHPLSSSSPPEFNLSQHHQGLFQGVSSLHQVVKVLELHEILVVPREKTPTGAAARGNP